MIWFISDTHFGHSNICYATSAWENKESTTRIFESVEDMNRAIVNAINDHVKEDDELYFLGDWSMGGIENVYNFWKQLKCKNIKFIPGNHDHRIKKNSILPNCQWSHHYENIIDWEPTEEEPTLEDSPVTSQDLFKMLPEITVITYKKQKFVLSHYPIEQWEDMDRGSIHLHGHTHHYIDGCITNSEYRRLDVGIDWQEFRPISIDEILEIMKDRKIGKHIDID